MLYEVAPYGHTLAVKTFLLTLLVLVSISSTVLADTYTGVVSEVKQFHSGGTAVDMDGAYPNQKMVLYVPAGETKVTKMPVVGDKVTATGEITQYKGRPEIKIHSDDQWKW
jgi:hypothetical protein